MDGSKVAKNIPQWLLAELTYKCPLHCPYCSNPTDFALQRDELTTDEWLSVFRQARAMGASQLGFSGGEPALRKDLEILVKEARAMGYYTNLITSAIGIDETRLNVLKDCGLDNIQISFQAHESGLNDFIAGTRSFEHKTAISKVAKSIGLSLGVNVVLHKHNLDFMEPILKMCVGFEPVYIELANTQYYGFGFLNQQALLPSQKQLDKAAAIAQKYQAQYVGQINIIYVVPDYFAVRPKACMNGWATVFMTIAPDGSALPCHASRVIKGLEFPNVREKSLEWIWKDSPAFNKFRGLGWMKEPCTSCPERFKDFGGCRCQAFLLTGDAANTDPVCDLSPLHHLVTNAVKKANETNPKVEALVFRTAKESKTRSEPNS